MRASTTPRARAPSSTRATPRGARARPPSRAVGRRARDGAAADDARDAWAAVDARGFGARRALDRARYVAKDSKARVALPTTRDGVVGARPFSDVVHGVAFCALTTYVLGACDAWMRARAIVNAPFMIGAWASLSVLAFGALDAPPLRWWNVCVATACSALLGVVVVRACGATPFARALALSASLAVMMRLGAIHPPAGAVAFACADAPAFVDLGWAYALYPALVGAVFIVGMGRACAWVKRRYEFTFADVARVASLGRARAPRDDARA